MTNGALLVADLLIAVLAAAGWLAGGAAAATGHRRVALGLGVGALVATLARAVTIVALARAGWWFAADKVLIAAPLSLAAMVVAATRRTPAALLFAGYATTAGVLVTVLHGYPVTPGVALLRRAATGGSILSSVAKSLSIRPLSIRALSRRLRAPLIVKPSS